MQRRMQFHRECQPLSALVVVLTLALVGAPVQAAGVGLSGYVFALDEQGKIAGTVAGATIEFKCVAVVRATADQNGRYTVQLSPGRTYTYKLRAAGFKEEDQQRALTTGNCNQVKNFGMSRDKSELSRESPDPADGNAVNAAGIPQQPPAETTAEGSAGVSNGAGFLQGEVVEKTAEGNEVPVAGATVYLRNQNGKRSLNQATTGTNEGKSKAGRFGLRLAAGTYTASVVAVGFAPFKQAESIAIVAGKTASRRFVLTRATPPESAGQGIKGTVRFAASGKAPAAPPPVAVSIVPVDGPDKAVVTVSPDAGSGFQRDLPEGRYRVVVVAKGYRTYPRTIPDAIVLRGSYTVVNAYLVPDMLLVAQVYERVGQGVRPLSGASVEVTNTKDPAGTAGQLTTDKRGYADVTLTEEGAYVAVARLAGYKASKSVAVVVSPKGPNQVALELAPEPQEAAPKSYSFDLIVAVKSGEEPATDAEVTIQRAGKTEVASSGKSGAGGTYLAEALGAGFYTVRATRNGFSAEKSVVHYQGDCIEVALAAAPTPPPPAPDPTPEPQPKEVDPIPVAPPGESNPILVPLPPGESNPIPVSRVLVPNLIGASESVVGSKLKECGLKEELRGDPPYSGTVTWQDPRPGVRVPPGTTIVVLIPKTLPPATVTLVPVPDVTYMSHADVRRKLADAGLTPGTLGDPNQGTSISQNPRAGERVKPGTTVVVRFLKTSEPPLVAVPDVVGANVANVRKTLAAAGLTPSTVGDPNQGTSTSQRPLAGEKVKSGTTVVVVFPKTPELPLVRVPDVTNMSHADVRRKLGEAGLSDGSGAGPYPGLSTSQSPRAGERVKPGTTVVVRFLKTSEPPLVAVPDVVGATVSNVQKSLAAAGLRLTPTGNPARGSSRSQNPRPGTKVPPGTTVVVAFSESEQAQNPPPRVTSVTVPSVTGLDARGALRVLTTAGFQANLKGAPSAERAATLQNPPAGSQARPGSVVDVYFPDRLRPQPVSNRPPPQPGFGAGIPLPVGPIGGKKH